MPRRAPRSWGYWTEGKLDILGKYLDAFTTATKTRASQRIYLDAFAGEPHGTSRTTGEPLRGSAYIALKTENPPFDRCYFFELPGKAEQLQAELARDFPGRFLRVVPGDCNQQIPNTLAQLRAAGLAWAPTFAFLDPDGMELRWETIAALAAHKQQLPRPSKTKVELWVLYPSTGVPRLLPLDQDRWVERHAEQVSALFGSDAWEPIYRLRQSGAIDGQEARERYVNLYRWQLEQQLGYYRAHAIQVNNRLDRPLYHLIFATDSPTGDKIMTYLYSKAMTRWPQMRDQARRRGPHGEQLGLLSPDDEAATYQRQAYLYVPPVEPAKI